MAKKDYKAIVEERRKAKGKSDSSSSSSKDYYDLVNKRRMENTIGFDTLDSDIQTIRTSMSNVSNGWQTAETMNNIRMSAVDINKRLDTYKEYMGKYQPGNPFDVTKFVDSYKSDLDAFNNMDAVYRRYTDGNAYDEEKKKLKELSEMSVDELEKKLSEKNSIAYTTAGGEDITWQSLYDEKNHKKMATSKEGVEGWEKYLSDMEKAESEKEDFNLWDYVLKGLSASDSTLPSSGLNNVVDAKREDNSYAMPTEDWTEEEQRIFGAYYNDDPKKAYEYGAKLNNQKNMAVKNEKLSEISDKASSSFGSGLGHTALSILASPTALYDYTDDLTDMLAGRPIVQEDYVTPFEYSQTVQGGIATHLNDEYGHFNDKIPIIGGKGIGDLYGLGTSIAQSAASAYTLGGIGTMASYFGQAGASGIDEALERGATDEEALKYGTALGFAEGISEAIGGERLVNIGPSSTVKEFAKNVVKQGIAEGAEEFATSVMGNIADDVIMDEKSNFNKSVRTDIAKGISEKEAKKNAWKDSAEEIAYDTLGGFISGAVHAVPQTAVETYKNNKSQKQIEEAIAKEKAIIKEKTDKMNIGEVTEVTATGNSTKVEGIKLNGDETVVVTSEGEMPISEMTFSQNEAEVLAYAEGLGERDGNILLANYDGKSDVDSYVASFNAVQFYTEKNYQQDFILENKGSLTERQALDIYTQTIKSQRLSTQKALDEITAKHSTTVVKEGVFDDSIIDYDNATTDGSKVNFNSLGTSQREAIMFMRLFSKATGMDVVLSNKGIEEGFNGKYLVKDNKIIVDVYAGIDKINAKTLKGTIIPTASHESTHWIENKAPMAYGELSDKVFEFLSAKKGLSAEELINDEVSRMKERHPEMNVTEEMAKREIVARACEDMLSGSAEARNLINSLSEETKKTFLDKVKSVVKNLIDWVNGVLGQYKSNSKEAKLLREYKAELEAVQKLWDNAFAEAVKVNQALKVEGVTAEQAVNKVTNKVGIGYDSKTESAYPTEQLSERTWTESEYVVNRENAIQNLSKALGVSERKAGKYVDAINSVAKLIADDRARLDYESNIDSNASVMKSNSDYKWSIDMSTLCAKRLLFTGTFDAIQKMLPNTALDSDDIVKLRKMMMDRSYQVACGICYVESTRREIGTITKDFIERYKEAQKNGTAISRINSKGKPVLLQEKGTKKNFYPEEGYTPTLAELNTTDIDIVKRDHPEVYGAYLSYMNARGQAKPKLLETRAEYKGEILDKFARKKNGDINSSTESMNASGGLRLQSFSDFEIAHLIDMMQIVMDMSNVGLMSQAYTKVAEFAEVFGDTGVKINLSLIAKGDGLDADGNLIFDDVEGIDHKRAFDLREKFSKNVGTILVGKNDAHIIKAMADPRIDYIIPFHKSSWKESLYDALGLTGYADYTDTQHEKAIDPNVTLKGDLKPSDYWDFTKSGDENTQIYLERCKDEGRIPKFPQFQGYPGYWKLLIDFKMYDNDGVGSPQTVVRPEFNMEAANRILNDYEGGHRSFPVAKDVVDDFVREYKESHPNVQYSDRQFEHDITQWAKEGRPDGEVFILGTTGDVLQGLGAIESDIYMNGDKIKTILSEHKEITLDEIKKIPKILRSPVLVLGSRNVGRGNKTNSRIVMFGSVKAKDGRPMLTVLDLRPVEKHLVVDDMQKITSAYTKDKNPVEFIEKSDVLYLNKKRTTSLLRTIGFQMPIELNESGYIGSVSYKDLRVNLNGKPFSDVVQYSDRDYAPTFYSHMSNVVDGIKAEKIGADSVVSYLKGRGVKDEEIKWSGIETFLEGKKSVTKAELQEFVQGNQLQIEETILADSVESADYARFKELWRENIDSTLSDEEFDQSLIEDVDGVKEYLLNEFSEYRFTTEEELDEMLNFLDSFDGVTQKETKWSEHTIKGGSNYREILFKMPNSTYSNESMEAHWGDIGILAHARIQDVSTKDKKSMLFVEEIQSDWHNEGQKKGYADNNARSESPTDIKNDIMKDDRFSRIAKKIESSGKKRFGARANLQWATERIANLFESFSSHQNIYMVESMLCQEADLFELNKKEQQAVDEYRNRFKKSNDTKTPDAPFKNNYHEYVLKRLLRMASEQGYDSIGWTTADIQAYRWSNKYIEGYRIEYDQDIPKFLRKYGKKWGATVGHTTTSNGDYVWSMDITDSMKESVLYEGQAQYSDRDNVSLYKKVGEEERLVRENKLLKEDIARLKTISDDTTITASRFKSLAQYLNKLSGANADVNVIGSELKDVYEFIKGTDNLQWTDLMVKTYDIASRILGNNPKVSRNYFKEVVSKIRGSKISISLEQQREVEKLYGNYNNFRKSMFSKMNITADGIPLSEMWQKWSEQYPNIFDANLNETEQLTELISIFDSLNKSSDLMSEYEQNESTRHLAIEIYNQYWNLIADKSDDTKAKKAVHRHLMERLRTDYQQRASEFTINPTGETALKYESMLKKVIAKDKAELKHVKELSKKRMDSYKESAEVRNVKQRITKEVLTLNRWLVSNSKKEHIPQALKPIVVNFLNSLEFSSNRFVDTGGQNPTKSDEYFAKALSKVHQMMANENKALDPESELEGYGMMFPESFVEYVGEYVNKVNAYVPDGNTYIINRMSLEDLQMLEKIVTTLKKSVTELNEFHAIKHNEGRADLSKQFMRYAESLGQTKLFTGVSGWMKDMTQFKSCVPYYVFKRFGESGMKVFEAFQDGWDKLAFNANRIIEYSNSLYTSEEAKQWRNEVHTMKIRGEEVKMTTTQIMSLYCLSRREQALKHILAGGIKIGDIKTKKEKIAREDGVNISEKELANIVSRLTDKQRYVADKLQEFMNTTCSDWGNEVTMALYGFKQFGEEKFYFPIKIDANTKTTETKDKENSIFRLLNMSFSKPLNENANNRIMVLDVFDEFSRHTSEMAKYNALALPVYDTFKWYNYKEKISLKGKEHNEVTLKQKMTKAFGSQATSYLYTFLQDINGVESSSRDSVGSKFFSNAKVASVAANIRVVVLQPTSYLRAGMVIDSKYLMKAFAHKPKVSKAMEHCGIALWKSLGFYDTNISKGLRDKIVHEDSLRDKIVEHSLSLAGKADEMTWGYLWNACELEIRDKRKDLKVGSKEFYEAVGKRLRDVIYATQVVDSTMTRSEMMRGKDMYDKMLTAFASEPTLSLNMLQDAFIQYKLDERAEGKKSAVRKNKKAIAKTITVYTVTNIACALIEAGFDVFRDDDEMEEGDFLEAFLENFKYDMGIIGKIPYLKELVSMIQGFSSSRTDTQWMEQLVKTGNDFVKLINDKGSFYTFTKDLIKALSSFTGLPGYNLWRDIQATLDSLNIIETDKIKDDFDYAYEVLKEIFNSIIGEEYPSQKIKD